MKTDYPLVHTKQFDREVVKWLAAIKRGENVLVTFFPKTDRLLRIQQLIEEKRFVKTNAKDLGAYFFLSLKFAFQNIEEKRDLQNAIAAQLNYLYLVKAPQDFDSWVAHFRKRGQQLVLIIPEVESLWAAEGQLSQTALSHLVEEYQSALSTLSFSEVDISHSSVLPFLPASMTLYQNMFYYPLYKKEDAEVFVEYLAQKWNIQLKPEVKDRILKDCGGHFWLLKEAVRQCDADTFPMYPGEGLKFRLDVIYRTLQLSEQNALTKSIKNKRNLTEEEKQSFEYLQKIGLFDGYGKCTIELFEDFIYARNELTTELFMRKHQIFLNQVPIENFFSRKEYKVIKILLERRGEIVSRDELAHHIWSSNTQEYYSDWAIDQLIARVRKRLRQLSLSPKLLQVIRGKGYLLKLS